VWIYSNKPSFLAFSRTHSNRSFRVANLSLVVNNTRWSIQTTGIGGRASSTFASPKQISSFAGGGGGFSELAFSESCTSSSKRTSNTIGCSISAGSSFGASTGTTITENSVKHSQKMNTVSILVQSRLRNPEYMNIVLNLFSGLVQYRSYDVTKRKL